MDLVLGLSMTSTAVRWVLVEGTTGEGAPIDRGALDIAAIATFDADGLLDALLDDDEAVAESRVHAIGVTWTSEAETAASAVLQALAARDLEMSSQSRRLRPPKRWQTASQTSPHMTTSPCASWNPTPPSLRWSTPTG